MSWKLQITRPAEKNLKKFPRKDQDAILAALAELEQDPFSGDIKRLQPPAGGWRRRVGNNRILYDLDLEARLIIVTGIVRRTSSTY